MTTMTTGNRRADHEIGEWFLRRWSPRSFLEKPVPEEDLLALFEAARWAPSAFNMQPWRFVLARTPEDAARFHSFISESNLVWAKKAPAIAAVLSQKADPERGPNRTHAFDTGAAWGFLALEAARRGIATHPIGGFDRDKAREVLQVPEDYDIWALVIIGYRGEPEALPEALRAREQPSSRRPIDDTVFEGGFGRALRS